jgi:hypothetical protein
MSRSANTAIRYNPEILEIWRQTYPLYADWNVAMIVDFLMRQSIAGAPGGLNNEK